jgi:formyl-CoA transferase
MADVTVKDVSSPENRKPRALAGVRVLDLTHQVAGPSATLALAFLGADVVKVVPPGDRSSFEATPFYLNNASKRSIEIDLKSADGHELALRLAEVADVFVENFSPGVVDRLGLSYADLSRRNPRLIYVQVKGFASDSPYANFPSFDPLVQAVSGASSMTGEPDGLPMKPGPDVGDTGTGMVTAIGILGALYQRMATGEGQHLEVAMADQVATFLRIHYSWPIERDLDTPRFGNGPPFLHTTAPSDLYPCKPFGPNDYVQIHCGNDRQWLRFADVIGRPDLKHDSRFATMTGRGDHKAEIDAIVTEWTSARDKFEAMETLGKAGVPAGAVRTTGEVLRDPDLRARGIFVPVVHPVHGEVPIPAWPVRMSGTRITVTAPPEPGRHTAEVLSEWLGEEAG